MSEAADRLGLTEEERADRAIDVAERALKMLSVTRAHRDNLQCRLDEALAVLADLREEKGLAAFREWLAGQETGAKARLVGERHGTNFYNGAIAALTGVRLEFDRRFGAPR